MDVFTEADRRGLTLTTTRSNNRLMWKWSGDARLRSPWFFTKGTALAWLEDEIAHRERHWRETANDVER
jgi:hypothetical protein